MKDYYKVLNITAQATQQEIRDAYMKLIIENHPDNNVGAEEKEQKTREITEAYSILSKPEKRKKYDEVYNDIYGIKLPQKEDVTLFDGLNFQLQDKTIITPKKVSEAIEDLIQKTKNKPLDEDREIYLEAYYRSVLPVKTNYENVVHIPRKQLSNESDKEYEIYMNEYYNVYQTETIKYIENTNIPMPRYRKPYETDEHYNKYLEVYYNMVFPQKEKKNDTPYLLEDKKKTSLLLEDKQAVIPLLEDKNSSILMIEDKKNYNMPLDDKQQLLLKTTKDSTPLLEDKSNNNSVAPVPPINKEKQIVKKRKQSKLKKLIKMIAFAATLLVSVLTTQKKTSEFSMPDDYKPVIENTDNNYNNNNDANSDKESMIDDDTLNQIDEMLNEKEEKVIPTVGDIVNLKEGQKFSYTSLGDGPSGTVGNKYTQPGEYIVDALSIVDSNNNLVAVTYSGGTSLDKLAEQYGVDLESGKYKVNYHFSNNDNLELLNGTADQRGWSTYDENNYDKVRNVIEQGMNK